MCNIPCPKVPPLLLLKIKNGLICKKEKEEQK
jgi:hypothetical protein